VAHSNNYFTVGMRGTGDGGMLGANTMDEQRKTLERILKDQRELIEKYVNKDATQVRQVFIPYKEVLDIYNSGLKVPDDITLMWCDDNYGYISYLPNKQEQARKGGNGIYYHLSYWGRPHDYLWLASTSPALIQTELEPLMKESELKTDSTYIQTISKGSINLQNSFPRHSMRLYLVNF